MFKKLMRVTVIGATVFALAACGNQQGAGDVGQYGVRNMSAQGIGNNTLHNNRYLASNRQIARAVERIPGISKANVIVGDTNAYVAVNLDRNRQGNRALGGNNSGLTSGNGVTSGNNGMIGGVSTRGITRGGMAGGLSSSITNYGAGTGVDRIGTSGLGTSRGFNNSMTNNSLFGLPDGVGTGSVTGNGVYDYGRATRFDRYNNGIAGNGWSGTMSGGMFSAGTHGRGLTGQGPVGPIGGTDLGGRQHYGRYVPMGVGVDNNGIGNGQSGRVGALDTGLNGLRSQYKYGTTNDMTSDRVTRRTNTADGIAPELRARIERAVRYMAPSVRNVYISADNGFVRQMDIFSGQLANNGEYSLFGRDNTPRNPMYGLTQGFNQFVRTIFVEPFDNDNDRFGLNRRDLRARDGVNGFLQRNFNGTSDVNRTPAGTINTAR